MNISIEYTPLTHTDTHTCQGYWYINPSVLVAMYTVMYGIVGVWPAGLASVIVYTIRIVTTDKYIITTFNNSVKCKS